MKIKYFTVVGSLLGWLVLGIWLSERTPLPVPDWIKDPDLPSFGSSSPIGRLAFYGFLIAVSTGVWHWLAALFVLRNRFLVGLWSGVRTALTSRRHLFLFLCTLLCLGSLVYDRYSIGYWRNQFLLPETITVVVGVAMVIFRPPVALVLTTSSGYGANLVEATHDAVWPLRTVFLLVPGLMSRSEVLVSEVDNLRTLKGGDWESSIERLTSSSAIIIMDVRIDSAHIRKEMIRLLNNGSQVRTLFVTTKDGVMPALRMISSTGSDKPLVYCPEIGVQNELDRYLKLGSTWPQHICLGSVADRTDFLRKAKRRLCGFTWVITPVMIEPSAVQYGTTQRELVQAMESHYSGMQAAVGKPLVSFQVGGGRRSPSFRLSIDWLSLIQNSIAAGTYDVVWATTSLNQRMTAMFCRWYGEGATSTVPFGSPEEHGSET